MPPITAFSVSIIGLVAALAIYLGARGTTLIHRLSAISGVAVVLCVSVLPFYLLKAFDNLGSEKYEAGFIAYLAASCIAAVVALACCVRLFYAGRGRAA
ncbi:hypothetical protein [Roseateles microcysteis]|uniref:hypothetical protein n=1 Tax=Roseateles microcysteis TaxID=3119057 RepID=UPI002FE5B087